MSFSQSRKSRVDCLGKGYALIPSAVPGNGMVGMVVLVRSGCSFSARRGSFFGILSFLSGLLRELVGGVVSISSEMGSRQEHVQNNIGELQNVVVLSKYNLRIFYKLLLIIFIFSLLSY